MTSSTFKSMGGVKVVALPASRCSSQCDDNANGSKAMNSAQRKRSIHLPPLCFDLDHGFDSEMDRVDESSTVQNSKASCHKMTVARSTLDTGMSARADSQINSSEKNSERKFLGHLLVDIVGVLFHKTAAAQPRNEGDPVFLVILVPYEYDECKYNGSLRCLQFLIKLFKMYFWVIYLLVSGS